MYGVCFAVRMVHSTAEGIQRVEAIYLWLEVVGNHHIEAILVSIKHHDRHGYTLHPQRNTLIGIGYSKVAHALMLEHTRHIHISCAIATRLDHSNDGMVTAESSLSAQASLPFRRRYATVNLCLICVAAH